jgi:hypothetical protein
MNFLEMINMVYKAFVELISGGNVIKPFTAVIYEFSYKAKVLLE